MGASQARRCSRSTTLIFPPSHSSRVSSTTPHLAQFAAWFGKVTMLSKPEEKCSVPPNHSTLSQELSEVTTASMSEETLSTDPMPLSLPTRKSSSGSSQRSLFSGLTTPPHGSTNDHLF